MKRQTKVSFKTAKLKLAGKNSQLYFHVDCRRKAVLRSGGTQGLLGVGVEESEDMNNEQRGAAHRKQQSKRCSLPEAQIRRLQSRFPWKRAMRRRETVNRIRVCCLFLEYTKLQLFPVYIVPRRRLTALLNWHFTSMNVYRIWNLVAGWAPLLYLVVLHQQQGVRRARVPPEHRWSLALGQAALCPGGHQDWEQGGRSGTDPLSV